MNGNMYPSWNDRPGELVRRSVPFDIVESNVKRAQKDLIAKMQSMDGTVERLVGLDTQRADAMAHRIAEHLPGYKVECKTTEEAYLSGPPIVIIARDADDPATLAQQLSDKARESPSAKRLFDNTKNRDILRSYISVKGVKGAEMRYIVNLYVVYA